MIVKKLLVLALIWGKQNDDLLFQCMSVKIGLNEVDFSV